MAKQDYLPNGDADKAVWLANFVEKAKNYAVLLGLSPATIIKLEEDRDAFVAALVLLDALRNSVEAVTAFKNRLRDGKTPLGVLPTLPTLPVVPPTLQSDIFGHVRQLVRAIKANPNYTETIGDDMRIIGDEITEDPNLWQPSLSVNFVAGAPHLKWTKGQSESIKIWVDRGTGYELLIVSTHKDYTDHHALPAEGQTALWKYKAVYLLHDSEVGQISPVLEVAVTGTGV